MSQQQPAQQGSDQVKGGPSAAGQNGAKSNRVCRHFVRGRCTWGNACRFSHESERSAGEGGDASIQPSTQAQPVQAQVPMEGGSQQPQQQPVQPQRISTPTFPPAPAPAPAAPQGPTSYAAQREWIGTQQAQLQQQRHAILRAAIDGQFAVRPIVAPDGQSHHTIHLTTIPSPEIAIQLLNEQQLRMQLHQLELDERVREGGLHYLIGEPNVFWSMIRHFHQTGTTTSSKWDALLLRVRQSNQVDCMFFRSAAGCLSQHCPFDHVAKSVVPASNQMLSMATSNALLQRVPSLGFGSVPSQDRLDAGGSNLHSPLPISGAYAQQQQLPAHHNTATVPQQHGASLFHSSPTLDELAAAASTPVIPQQQQAGQDWRGKGHGREDDFSKQLWGMLAVDQHQPVPVTTAPSHSIW